ncbi:uncharacterized protein LOC126164345 [Schistocerca cancellata]|uniref:uncharacterized protein LOC126164345 n=1 Tax=Schistocerca cancellata TaxID=274614 RepID=UPI0021196DA4|nr:uncharacterized protein LOC126164345 [Schistocerca cancellata]
MEEENMETTHINFKTKLYKVLENFSTPYQNITAITVGNRTPIECIWIVISASTASLFRDKYSEYCKEKQVPAVSESKFREIFVSEFNIGFKLPISDTCSKCDGFLITINNSELCAEVTEKKQQYELHLKKADRGQNMIASLTALAKENSKEHQMIAVDMQQTFPTPKLTVAPAFYKRKIRTYNYGIHDCESNKAYMFLWSEKDGGRGSDEFGSCLLKYLEITSPQTKHLHIIKDNCKGQAKNWTIIALERFLVATKRFDSVQHYFPVLLKKTIGENLFCGHIYGPNIFLTDDSQAEQSAILSSFPSSEVLLCIFHVLQAVWRWLSKRSLYWQKSAIFDPSMVCVLGLEGLQNN